jgi:hypothetical protein
VAFLQRAAAALKPGGMLFVKENVCERGFIVDSSDASVTRSHQYYGQLFERAGLRMSHTALQKDFPRPLFKGGWVAMLGGTRACGAAHHGRVWRRRAALPFFLGFLCRHC